MEISKIQKWLFQYLKFQPKKDFDEKVETAVDSLNHLKRIQGTNSVDERRQEVEQILGDLLLKILEITNDLQCDMNTILKTHFKLGV